VSDELEHIWSRVQAELALVVDEPTYRIWLEPLRARSLVEERLLVEAPAHACGWIRDRFGSVLQTRASSSVIGPDSRVELVSSHDPAARRSAAERRRRLTRIGRPPAAAAPRPRPGGDRPAGSTATTRSAEPLGNPKLTFEQFVIGDCNRLAHAAALTVAEMPAQAYNPLFICGPPGVGKTHLLSSIADLLLAHNPGLTVRCTTGEAFTNEFLGALSGGASTEASRRAFATSTCC
jgi:chromosomal replication initiator protein